MNYQQRQMLAARMFERTADGNISERYAKADPRELPPLILAYIGDAYYHLFIRNRLLSFNQSDIQLLHDFAAKLVSATWQAKVYHCLSDRLTEREQEIFRRGRNAKSHVPKSAGVADYRISTGLEALLGALYLSGETERLEELAEAAFQIMAQELAHKP